MIIEHCHSKNLNFGDDLNLWLWPQILGDYLNQDDDIIFMGIGTIINQKRYVKYLSHARKIVLFGSGASIGALPTIDEQWVVYGVRGPDTARRLALGEDMVIGDPAYLLRNIDTLPDAIKDTEKTIGFIPHHRSEDYVDWIPLCNEVGLRYISPRQPVVDFLAQLRGCEKVITEAMHGAITADALRIPWMAISFSPNFNSQKWEDFLESMDISITSIHKIPFAQNKIRSPGRYIEHGIKHSINSLVGYPHSWAKVPFTFPWSFQRRKIEITNALTDLMNGDFTLSTDLTLNTIIARQLQAIERFKTEYPFA